MGKKLLRSFSESNSKQYIQLSLSETPRRFSWGLGTTSSLITIFHLYELIFCYIVYLVYRRCRHVFRIMENFALLELTVQKLSTYKIHLYRKHNSRGNYLLIYNVFKAIFDVNVTIIIIFIHYNLNNSILLARNPFLAQAH